MGTMRVSAVQGNRWELVQKGDYEEQHHKIEKILAGAGGELRLGAVEQLLNTQLHKQASMAIVYMYISGCLWQIAMLSLAGAHRVYRHCVALPIFEARFGSPSCQSFTCDICDLVTTFHLPGLQMGTI